MAVGLSGSMKSTKTITIGIMSALVLWGIWLAVGATGMFIQEDMMDTRKSAIVVAFVALFLGLWAIVLFGSKSKWKRGDAAGDPAVVGEATSGTATSSSTATQASSSSSGATLPWSRSGLTTVGLLLAGVILWGSAILSWQSSQLSLTTVLGWLAALCVTGSSTAGIIALSGKRRQRGKLLGFLGLLGFAAAFVLFLMRMTP